MARVTMTEIDMLFNKLEEYPYYPSTMSQIRGEIKGTSFFPGGKGIIDGNEKISTKKFMMLGQDWGTLKGYITDVENGQEPIMSNPTWRNLLNLLDECRIKSSDCFFTNAIMGVRQEGNVIGPSPAFRDVVFIQNCRQLFLFQLEIQRPKYLFVLGHQVAKFLAGTSTQLEAWSKAKTYKAFDEQNEQIKKNIIFQNGVSSNLVLLMHPSARKYNLDKREYNGEYGEKAQIKMIEELLLESL